MLIYIHKEQMLDEVVATLPGPPLRHDRRQAAHPCRDEADLGERVITVFPRQGHYALDKANLVTYPPADITIEHIGELATMDLAVFSA